MWTAIFWADGEMPHEIFSHALRHRVEFEADKFMERMTHPHVGLWWIELWRDDERVSYARNVPALSGPDGV